MSSIFGIFYKHKRMAPKLASHIAEHINHWQADRIGTWHDQSTALGCLQLFNSAESLNEQQPIKIGPYVCVADCRIDNRSELAKTLQLNPSTPDTTLIVHAYLKWGTTCTQRLIGDFTFIIWDQKCHRLFCARDHIGVKPLFYYNDSNLFAIATEIKALFNIPEIKKTISEKNLASLLTHELIMNCDYSENTLYKNIYRLTPAHQCVVTDRGFFKTQYWALDPKKETQLADEKDYIAQYQALLKQSVKDRLRSHRYIASELSGGIDSSAVTAQAAQLNKTLHAITHVAPKNPTYLDETMYANMLCSHNDIQHHHLIDADKYNISNATQYSLLVADQPLLVNNPILAHDVHKKAKQEDCGVLLSGFGGDECATGHAAYRLQTLAKQKQWRILWHEYQSRGIIENKKSLRPFISHYLENQYQQVYNTLKKLKRTNSIPIYTLHDLIINPEFAKAQGVSEILPDARTRRNYQTVREREYHDLVGTESWHLRARIETSQLCGLGMRFEYRYPLLDIRLLEFCLSVPDDMKRHFGYGRYLARKSLEGLLPRELQWRYDKAGSPVPAALYYTKEQGHLAETLQNIPFSKELQYYFGDINPEKFTQKNALLALFSFRAGMQALALHYLSKG